MRSGLVWITHSNGVVFVCYCVFAVPRYVQGSKVLDIDEGTIEIKNEQQIQGMRQACVVARCVLDAVAPFVKVCSVVNSSRAQQTIFKVGITTDELDRICHEEMLSRGAYPSTLGYRGFPKSLCTSINEVAVHGIPDTTILQNGDIITLDVTVFFSMHTEKSSATRRDC
jgi:methionyl aminopeptidase